MNCEISTNDCLDGLALLIPITGCNLKCKFCYNSQLWDKKTDKLVLKKVISRAIENGIINFVFGGNNPIGENYLITKMLIKHIRGYSKVLKSKSNIELQIGSLNGRDLNIINYLAPDKLSITINSFDNNQFNNISKLEFPYRLKEIFINDELTLYPPVDIDEVVQFQPKNAYDKEYQKFDQPTCKQVYNYTKSIKAKAFFTIDRGLQIL